MNQGMKKWGAAVLAAGIVLGGSAGLGQQAVHAAAQTAVKNGVNQPSVILKYKGQAIKQGGMIVGGNTMIPVTVLRDSLGLALNYNPGTKTYSLGSGYTKLNMELSEYGVSTNMNGNYLYGDHDEYEVKNINGHLYVPFRLLSDLMGFQGEWNPSLKSLDMSNREQNKITISSETITKNNQNATILIRYPKVSGLENAEAEKAINQAFKDEADKFAEESEKTSKKRDASIEHPYEFIQSFLVTFNREGVLSVVTDEYSYTGGAHGMTLREGKTFSIKDGQKLELGDLLKAEPHYMEKLNTIIAAKTKKDEGINGFTKLRDNPDFYIKEGGLTIFFQQYEIAPYAYGFPTYTIPFSDVLPKGSNPFAAAQ